MEEKILFWNMINNIMLYKKKNAKTNDKEENKKSMSCKALLLKRTIRMKMLLVLIIFIHSPCI